MLRSEESILELEILGQRARRGLRLRCTEDAGSYKSDAAGGTYLS